MVAIDAGHRAESARILPAQSMRSLPELEAVIETGMTRFMEVGNALLEINERQLYRERGYARFEDYCRERIDLGRRRAYQLMAATGTVNAMCTLVHTAPLPNRETYVRELVPLAKKSPETAAQVWQDVYEATNGRPHVKAIRQAVQDARRKEESDTASKSTVVVNTRVSMSDDAVIDRRDLIRHLATDGFHSTAQIAERVGLTVGRVAAIVHELGLPGEVERRRTVIRQLVAEGYRDDQIAASVGLSEATISAVLRDMGLPSQAERMGKQRRGIDHNRAMSGLIESCTPTPESIAVIDMAQIDFARIPEWDTALTDAIQTLTKLRSQLRKRLTEGSHGS